MLANNVLLSEDLEEGFTDFSCFAEFKKNLTIRPASRDEKFNCVRMFEETDEQEMSYQQYVALSEI